MRKQLIQIVNGIFTAALTLFLLAANAQRDIQGVTQNQVNRINELVRPIKDQMDKVLNEDRTGTYANYLGEIKNLNSMKNSREKSSSAKQILDKYSGFFKETWAAVKVDERSYQDKIRQILSDVAGADVEFQLYLNFSVHFSTNSTSRAPEPLAPNKCLDVCTIAAGEVNGSAGLISGGGGDYGNCFLRTNAWGALAAKSELYGFLRNNIKIPGTFPSDNRKLHVNKDYQLRQECSSFAAIGFGYAETWARTYQSSEYLFVMSPVIYGCTKFNFKTMSEDYLLDKKDVAKSIFKTYAGTWAYGVSANWCYTDCASIKWKICEQ